MEFDKKRILVTGSTRGIGRAIAERFAREGARVAINGRDHARADAVCQALGADAIAVPGDLTTAAGCAAVVDKVITTFGGLDILINNAGVFPIASMEETDEQMWDDTMSGNVRACSLPAAPRSVPCAARAA